MSIDVSKLRSVDVAGLQAAGYVLNELRSWWLGYSVASWAHNRDRASSYLVRIQPKIRDGVYPPEVEILVSGRRYFFEGQWRAFVDPFTMFPYSQVLQVWGITRP